MSHIDEGELTAYADGAFAPESADARRIAAHLSECANCRNLLAQAEATNIRARDILAIATPETIVVPALPKRRSVVIPVAWAASIALALGLGYWSRDQFMMQTADAPQTPPVAVSVPTNQAAPQAKVEDKPVVVAAKPADARKELRREAGPAAEVSAPPPAMMAPQLGASAATDFDARLASKSVAEADVVNSHAIPGLDVVSVKSITNGSIIEQRLPDGKVITVTATHTPFNRNFAERNEAAGAAARKMELKLPEATVVRGSYTIRVMGALPIDSLNALARKIN